MNLSFSITKPAIALWWAVAWRSIVWSFALMIPAMAVGFVIGFIFGFTRTVVTLAFPALAPAFMVLDVLINLTIQFLVMPIAIKAFVFWRILRKGRIGSYAISVTRDEKPLEGSGQYVRFAAIYYLNLVLYLWPLYLAGVVMGVMLAMGSLHIKQLLWVSLFTMPVSLYLYWLVITDIIRLGKIGPYAFTMKKIVPNA